CPDAGDRRPARALPGPLAARPRGHPGALPTAGRGSSPRHDRPARRRPGRPRGRGGPAMNPVPMAISAVDAASLAPELVLTAGGVVILLLDAFLRTGRRLATPLAAFALVAAAVVVPGAGGESSSSHGFLEARPATWMLAILVLITALISLLAADGFLRRHRLLGGEYHALFLWCTAGILLMS